MSEKKVYDLNYNKNQFPGNNIYCVFSINLVLDFLDI